MSRNAPNVELLWHEDRDLCFNETLSLNVLRILMLVCLAPFVTGDNTVTAEHTGTLLGSYLVGIRGMQQGRF